MRELRSSDLRHARELRRADAELQKAILVAMNTAVTKAESASEKRADASNEIRSAMMDQQRLLMPRLEADAEGRSRDDKLAELRQGYLASRDTMSGARVGWGLALVAASLLTSVIAVAFTMSGGCGARP